MDRRVDDDKLDELMDQLISKKEEKETLKRMIFEKTGEELTDIHKRMVVELMERLKACETEEEKVASIKKSFEDIHKFYRDIFEGKLTPYQ